MRSIDTLIITEDKTTRRQTQVNISAYRETSTNYTMKTISRGVVQGGVYQYEN